jgi:methionyl-tRNA formyltransferase
MNRLKITFLNDNPDNWMKPHLDRMVKLLNENHSVDVVFKEEDIKNGDILFILSFYKLVSSESLKLNKNNIVIHASDLPEGKGWSPATWQILEGKNEIPLTMFEAVEKTDAGPVFIKSKISLDGSELIEQWQDKMGAEISKMVLDFVSKYPEIKSVPQSGPGTFYPKRTPKDSEFDPDKTISEQFNLFRVVDNEKYPAFFYYRGKKYILKISKSGD